MKRTIAFFEVADSCPAELPKLSREESEVFNLINNEGAASARAILATYKFQSQSVLNQALGRLRTLGLVSRRNVTVEQGE